MNREGEKSIHNASCVMEQFLLLEYIPFNFQTTKF